MLSLSLWSTEKTIGSSQQGMQLESLNRKKAIGDSGLLNFTWVQAGAKKITNSKITLIVLVLKMIAIGFHVIMPQL